MELEESWKEVLLEELKKPYVRELKNFVLQEFEKGEVYPPKEEVFQAFHLTPFSLVKVVILGQDPYHGQGQAHGLCFSVKKGVALPPSLKNIFKELKGDLGIPTPEHGFLGGWARQGVFLLNTTLTVRRGEPLSHHGHGWERFTDAVVSALSLRKERTVFLLWGRSAIEKGSMIDETKHLVLKAAHPSPFSASKFLGCKHFSKTNAFLEKIGKKPIDWGLL